MIGLTHQWALLFTARFAVITGISLVFLWRSIHKDKIIALDYKIRSFSFCAGRMRIICDVFLFFRFFFLAFLLWKECLIRLENLFYLEMDPGALDLIEIKLIFFDFFKFKLYFQRIKLHRALSKLWGDYFSQLPYSPGILGPWTFQ